jgi:exodeoxyribonuclease III
MTRARVPLGGGPIEPPARDGPGTAPVPGAPAPGTPRPGFTVLTWNVQHSAPARARRQAEWLAAREEADVVVLTEVGGGPGGTALVQALGGLGYRVVVPRVPAGDYRVVVAARVGTLRPAGPSVAVLSHRFVVTRLELQGARATVAGVYVPSRGPAGHRNRSKRVFQEAVAAYLPRLGSVAPGDVVIAGDLNVVEPGHRPHHPVFGEWEYEFYRGFARHGGLVDAFRALHPDAVEHSWVGRSGLGYRFDHIFAACRRLVLRACRYLQDGRTEGLSDHAAMAAAFEVGGAG